jgi:hypothetical protein
VGLYSNVAGPQVLVERSNGSQWQIQGVPNRAGTTNAALVAVDCVNLHDCTAVGGSGDAVGPRVSLIEHWDGTAWSVVPAPTPPGAEFAELLDVSCSTATSCDAIGDAVRGDADRPYAVHWDGHRWTLEKIPVSDFAELVTVPSLSCPRPHTCFAVGTYVVVTGDRHVLQRALLLRWDGHQWRRRAGAKLPEGASSELDTVACSSPTQCLAVGFEFEDGRGGILNERWDGKRWTTVDGSGFGLRFFPSGLACRSAVSCFAVGSSFGPAGPVPGVAHWDGKKWSSLRSQSPSGTTAAGLAGVDCPLRTRCYAAGLYQNALGSFTLVLRGR